MNAWEPKVLLWRVLRGIEAGIIGGLAMLALLIAAMMFRGYPWWAQPTLLGTTFYGLRSIVAGPNRATIAGGALHLVITGVVGAVFGVMCGGVRRRQRLLLLGTLAGMVWSMLADAVFWRRVNPLVPMYSPQPATLLSHALFGACLGYMGRGMNGASDAQDDPTG